MGSRSTPILDAIKAEIFGGFVGEKAVIKPSPGGPGGANEKKVNYDSVKLAIINSPDLGKITDQQMADRYNVSRGYAGKLRSMRGIPPYIDSKKRESLTRKKIVESPLLGKCCDFDLANEIGTTENYVRKIRKELGIPICSDRIPSWIDELFIKWKVLPEQRGLTKREWKAYVRENVA